MPLIGITGKKGSGKSTTADYIVEKYGYISMSWADPLKEAVCALFGITREDELWMKNDSNIKVILADGLESISEYSLGRFEQLLGTEVGRNIFGQNHWINLLDKHLRKFEGEKNIVIPDCRFPNEVEYINRRKDGIIINIIRPHLDVESTPSRPLDHESEIHEFEYDYQIKNNHSTKSWLYGDIDAIMGLIALDKTA